MKNSVWNLILSIVLLGFSFVGFSQKINTDSLLQVVIDDVRAQRYESAITKARLGIKESPNYLDFHLFLGRSFEMTQQADSATYYYKYVIERNPKYKDAYNYLIGLQFKQDQYKEAEATIDDALTHYPEDNQLYLKKAAVYRNLDEEEKEYEYLRNLPSDIRNTSEVQQRMYFLELQNKNDRIGFSYAITAFDRDGVGPWHLSSIRYVHDRKWGSLIGSFNYTNRQSGGETLIDGKQFEIESYFHTGPNSYSYADVAYSNDRVFQKWRLGFSYFQNYNKGWETETGLRYLKTENDEIFGYTLALGKYVGSWWINLRHNMSENDGKYSPAVSLTSRLYHGNTRFDYYQFSIGYGTQLEDPVALSLFGQRALLDSYRFGMGYHKIFAEKYFIGLSFNYNNQEFIRNRTQNEYTFTLSFQYKL